MGSSGISKVKSLECWRFDELTDEAKDMQSLAETANDFGDLEKHCRNGGQILLEKLTLDTFKDPEEWKYLDECFRIHRRSCDRLQSQLTKLQELFPKFPE